MSNNFALFIQNLVSSYLVNSAFKAKWVCLHSLGIKISKFQVIIVPVQLIYFSIKILLFEYGIIHKLC